MVETLETMGARLVAARTVSDEDCAALRRLIWASSKVDRSTADLLFKINDALAAPSSPFCDLLCEAICHMLLRQEWPHDFVSDANAAWLIAAVDRDELIIRVFEQAENAPDILKSWALRQIENSILTGTGPMRSGGAISAGTVDDSEVALIRRLIFASAGNESLHVSRDEAEFMFRIKDLTLGKANSAQWQTLFVQAVANHLMALNQTHALSLTEAKRLNGFMDNVSVNLSAVFTKMSRWATIKQGFSGSDEAPVPDHDALVDQALQIAPDEAAWLKRQIAADASTDPLEKALLAFIVDEGVELPSELGAMRAA
jgi:hypothetical protein